MFSCPGAGFLTELGYDTTVSVRSDKVLKNFDQDMANKVKSVMQELGNVVGYSLGSSMVYSCCRYQVSHGIRAGFTH